MSEECVLWPRNVLRQQSRVWRPIPTTFDDLFVPHRASTHDNDDDDDEEDKVEKGEMGCYFFERCFELRDDAFAYIGLQQRRVTCTRGQASYNNNNDNNNDGATYCQWTMRARSETSGRAHWRHCSESTPIDAPTHTQQGDK